MAVAYDDNSKLFQVSYQAPFGGIDTTAYASAINPANFAAMASGINDANVLLPVTWESGIISNFNSASDEVYLGYIPLAESSIVGYIVTLGTVVEVASDGAGGFTYTAPSSANYTPAVSTYGYFSYAVIEGQLIWTTETWAEMWTYDQATQTTTRLTNYVGGGYLGELDNQLINLGGVSAADGEVPYRISWSAPGEYGVFQPYDVGSNTGSYAAGFNDLPSTSDVLQGIITIGTVAYLIRSQGVTQMNPTGNGIDPFQFNHLWASELGIGTVLPDSISQYGALGCFVSDSGIYCLGLSGVQEISGPAKELLYKAINNIPNFAKLSALPKGIVTARCVPYLNSHASTYYVIGILTGMTTAPTGVPPTVNTYQIYAIDLGNSYACYDLGTRTVAVSGTIPSANAAGKLTFINRAYSTSPSPAPPTPPSYPFWSNTTFYTPYNIWLIASATVVEPDLYTLTTSGSIPASFNSAAADLTAPAAIGDTATLGSAVFTYGGKAIWNTGTNYILSQLTTLVTGSLGTETIVGYNCTQAGISGGSQAGWSITPGDTITDGTVTWQCIGLVAELVSANLTPSNATSYNVSAGSIIVDPSGFLQQNTNSAIGRYNYTYNIPVPPHSPVTIYVNTPGGFSQTIPPTWNETTGGVTNETKVLTTPIPAATWVCLGARPTPPTSLIGANIQQIVPLFISINNVNYNTTNNTFSADELIGPDNNTGTFTFRKEQMKFGYLPTVSKIGFIASVIDTSLDGVISCSVDGGLSFNSAFKDLTITTGTTQASKGIYDNVYLDGVQTLERPQLVVSLTNVQIVEAWYQGTLADYPVI